MPADKNTLVGGKMSRSQDTSLCSSIARYARLLGIGAVASLLVVSVGHTQKMGNGPPSNNPGNGPPANNPGNGPPANNPGQTKGEAASDRALRLLTLAPVPVSALNTTGGAMYSFDISFVDLATQTYYLADRSNKAVDVVDAKTGQFVTQIFGNFKGFTPCSPAAGANDCAGPNGVVAAFPWLFVTDGGSRVVSFDLRTSPPTL